MSHSLLLPPLSKVVEYEGTGNFSVKRYYKWPFSFFYCHKLDMILDLMDSGRVYISIVDFGCGKAKILKESLNIRSLNVSCVDKDDDIKGRYDLIVCASVLEFVNLKLVLPRLKSHLIHGGQLIGASPMDTRLSRFYFRLIGDKRKRHSHKTILTELHKQFFVTKKVEWFGLYFSFKAYAR